MKMRKRAAALLLALAMLLTVCGCKKSDDRGGNGDVQGLDGEVPVDLGGYEFTVVDNSSGRWNKENSGTPYSDAWIQIMDEVETLYNCTITANYVGSTETFTTVQPEVVAGGKYADLIITAQWQYGYLLGANLMMDLKELDVNWDNEWWNQDVREMGTYGGKSYVGLGSFIFDTAQTWLLYYNEAVWNELGLPDPYELVDSHQWTYDKYTDYALRACEDRDGSGILDSYDDRWGMLASNSDFSNALFFALGGQFFKTDEKGRVKLACNTQKTYTIYEKMYNFTRRDKGMYLDGTYGMDAEANRIGCFMSNNALFYGYMPGVSQLKDMEDNWGVMPLPLLDADQEDYLSGVDHNASVFGVTNTNTDTYEVSVLLEALGRHAMILEDIFWPDYKETYWRHEEEDTRMVSQYVVGHGKHDLALLMQNCNPIFRSPKDRVFQGVMCGGSADLASYMDSVEGMIEGQLEEYFKYDLDAEAGETVEGETEEQGEM